MNKIKKKPKSITFAQINGDTYRINSIRNSVEFEVGKILTRKQVQNLIDESEFGITIGRNNG